MHVSFFSCNQFFLVFFFSLPFSIYTHLCTNPLRYSIKHIIYLNKTPSPKFCLILIFTVNLSPSKCSEALTDTVLQLLHDLSELYPQLQRKIPFTFLLKVNIIFRDTMAEFSLLNKTTSDKKEIHLERNGLNCSFDDYRREDKRHTKFISQAFSFLMINRHTVLFEVSIQNELQNCSCQ